MNKIKEVKALADYILGMGDALKNERASKNLHAASEWLKELSENMCGQGFIGCEGEDCDSDHK